MGLWLHSILILFNALLLCAISGAVSLKDAFPDSPFNSPGFVSDPRCNLANLNVDIIWMLDESRSVRKGNYDILKNFVGKAIDPYDFSVTRFGLIEFGSIVGTVINLDKYGTHSEFTDAVEKLEYNPGYSRTMDAFRYMNYIYFRDERNQKRPGTKRIVILATDGEPTPKAEQAGQKLRSEVRFMLSNHVDELIYMPIGNRANSKLFSLLRPFEIRDMIRVMPQTSFPFLQNLELGLALELTRCGAPTASPTSSPTTSEPTVSPTTSRPTSSPTRSPYGLCQGPRIVAAVDRSLSVGDRAYVEQVRLLEFLSKELYIGEDNAHMGVVSLTKYAEDVVPPPERNQDTYNFTTAEDYFSQQSTFSTQSLEQAVAYFRRRRAVGMFTDFVHLLEEYAEKRLTGYGDKGTIILLSDGVPFVNFPEGFNSTRSLELACAKATQVREENPDLNILCYQSRKRMYTPFFKCACTGKWMNLDSRNPEQALVHVAREMRSHICPPEQKQPDPCAEVESQTHSSLDSKMQTCLSIRRNIYGEPADGRETSGTCAFKEGVCRVASHATPIYGAPQAVPGTP